MNLYQNGREADWGPAPHKISWIEMCKRLTDANPSRAKEIGGGAPLFMSDHIHRLNGSDYGDKTKELLCSLRPEDAIHIPHLRIDCNSGKIIEWNRSLCDLTGISPAQVVGKHYAELLDEWIPNLTKEYKQAALEWVKKEDDPDSEYDEEGCREEYLFPLPLPIKYHSSFKYVSGNKHCDEYIELLVARADRLFELYPQFTKIPQCDESDEKYRMNFDTSGWVGGVEFTLRRKQYIPSLQALCRELLPKGDHTLNEDGSSAVTKVTPEKSEDKFQTRNEIPEVYTTISNYMRSCGPLGVRYIREVMNAVHKRSRNSGLRTKCFNFSADWSSNPETSTVHKYVLFSLGGSELITETIDKGKLVWTLNSEVGGVDGEGLSKFQLNKLKRRKASKVTNYWDKFKTWLTPVIAENKHFPITCGASDSTFILPTVNRPERTVLTLKIEGHKCSDGYSSEEKFKAHATVVVPASLNLFQLHRVVCLTMNCGAHGIGETHEWRVPNVNSNSEYSITDGDKAEYVKIGEAYFVKNGERANYYGRREKVLFDTGAAVRQRVSRTGAFVDQDMPLYPPSLDFDDYHRHLIRNHNSEKMKACIHSTCISAVFFQPGTTALLQDGFLEVNFASYKITCTKSEEYAGPLPLNPDINVMQPKCLRGKPEEDSPYWSVERANKLLHNDRGCLRRNLCKVGSDDFLVQIPFCNVLSYPIYSQLTEDRGTIPHPIAVHLTGLDHHPMFLYGEPTLPSSKDYEGYVSSLRGKIDPDFLQENIMGRGGRFAVPLKCGGSRREDGRSSLGSSGGYYTYSDEIDGDEPPGPKPGIGHVWASEVDEEMKRIDSLEPKKTTKGKKRKAPSKTASLSS